MGRLGRVDLVRPPLLKKAQRPEAAPVRLGNHKNLWEEAAGGPRLTSFRAQNAEHRAGSPGGYEQGRKVRILAFWASVWSWRGAHLAARAPGRLRAGLWPRISAQPVSARCVPLTWQLPLSELKCSSASWKDTWGA